MTYEKVTPPEWNPTFRVPFLAIQEVEGILKDALFHTIIENDGGEGTFRARGDKAPFVPYVRSVD